MLFCRLDLSSAPAAEVTETSLPTKIYSVIELEDEETVGTDVKEGTEQDGSKMEEEKNEIDDTFADRGRVRTDENKIETRVATDRENERKKVEIEERIASNEQRTEGTVNNRNKTARAKPIGPLSQTHSVQNGLALKSPTDKSKPTRQENVTLLQSYKTRTSNETRSTVKTTKATWANKTTELNNPRLEKIRQLRKKNETSQPTLRQNTRPPRTNTTEEILACKIPALEPFHPQVAGLQHNVGTNLRKICRSMYPYTPAFNVVNNKLVLKDSVKEGGIVKSSIKLRKIRRLDDEDFRYTKPRNPFNDLSNLYESNDIGQSDFFRLEYKIDGRYASDLYARVSPKLDVLERQTKLARKFQEKGLPLNVLIIGFDSASRANFVRKLPRVKSFLETELTTYFMEGMSIVGDATTPILTAMFTGKNEKRLPEGRTSFGG